MIAERSPFARFPGTAAFGEDEHAFRKELRAFLDAHPAPPFDYARYEESVDAVLAWHGELAEAGYPVPECPAEYGGRPRSLGLQLVQAEEMAAAHATFSVNIVGISMATPLLVAMGSEDQKRRFLPPIVAGRELWCQLFSEPDAGSDLFALRSSAKPDGDVLRVNGQKVWSSTADLAGWGIMLARTDPEAPRRAGISCFIVDMRAPGITVRPIREMTGGTSFCEVFFDDVAVPMHHLVGELHHGALAALAVLSAERTGLTLGNYASLIARFQPLADGAADAESRHRSRLVGLYAALAVQRLNALRTVSVERRESDVFGLAALGKLALGVNAAELSFAAVEMAGAWATAHPDDNDEIVGVVGWLNRCLALSIGGGTHEMQRNAVAERLLGLPR